MNPLTPEQVKEVLRASRSLQPRIRNLGYALENIEKNTADIYAQSVRRPTDGMPAAPRHGDKTATVALNHIQDMEQQKRTLQTEKRVLENADRQITTALSALREEPRCILHEKYVAGKVWVDVLCALGEKFLVCSERTLQRRGDAALHELACLLQLTPQEYGLVVRHLP